MDVKRIRGVRLLFLDIDLEISRAFFHIYGIGAADEPEKCDACIHHESTKDCLPLAAIAFLHEKWQEKEGSRQKWHRKESQPVERSHTIFFRGRSEVCT